MQQQGLRPCSGVSPTSERIDAQFIGHARDVRKQIADPQPDSPRRLNFQGLPSHLRSALIACDSRSGFHFAALPSSFGQSPAWGRTYRHATRRRP